MHFWIPIACLSDPSIAESTADSSSRKHIKPSFFMSSNPRQAPVPPSPVASKEPMEASGDNATKPKAPQPNPTANSRVEIGGDRVGVQNTLLVQRNRSSVPVVEKPHTMHILHQSYSDIRDRYSLGPELGRGQFGIIRMCVERASGTPWACKCISKSRLASNQDVMDVQREVRAMKVVSGHPSIIGLKETIEDSRRVYIVMDLCEGGELFERITAKKRYSERDAAQVFCTLASVVEHCHNRGVMHRDLKPENILLCSADSDIDIKIVDFGLAVFMETGKKLEAMAGSAYYIAPEVLAGSYGLEADVWSIGIILYILLCGMPPFWHEEEEGIFEAIRVGKYELTKGPWRKISVGAKDLVARILVHNPQERLTLDQIFEHPWLREYCVFKPLEPTPIALPLPPLEGRSSARPVTSFDPSKLYRSNSGESLGSSQFSELSPRGSRKWVPYEHSSSFSGQFPGGLRPSPPSESSGRRGGRVRGGSGDMLPVNYYLPSFSGEQPQPSAYSAEFLSHMQRAGFSAEYSVPPTPRFPSQRMSKTGSFTGGHNSARNQRLLSSELQAIGIKPRLNPLPAVGAGPSSSSHASGPQPAVSGVGLPRNIAETALPLTALSRTDANERLRSLSFGTGGPPDRSRVAPGAGVRLLDQGTDRGREGDVSTDGDDGHIRGSQVAEGTFQGLSRRARFSFKLDLKNKTKGKQQLH